MYCFMENLHIIIKRKKEKIIKAHLVGRDVCKMLTKICISCGQVVVKIIYKKQQFLDTFLLMKNRRKVM